MKKDVIEEICDCEDAKCLKLSCPSSNLDKPIIIFWGNFIIFIALMSNNADHVDHGLHWLYV
jgi:hypothetical protein